MQGMSGQWAGDERAMGRERTGVEVFNWAKRAEELGAGEIMITSIDREGTGKGFDLELAMVDEFMTENPEFLSPEDPLAYALNKMHVGGFRHVPVLNDSMLPVGLISINNVISTIADYFSMEIINLPPLNRLIDSDKQEGG